MASVSYIFLPNSIEDSSFLTPTERTFAIQRLRMDRPMKGAATADGDSSPHANERLDWSEVGRGVMNVQTWLSASAYFSILAGLYSFSLFTPSIINSLGYTATRAQLFSVPRKAIVLNLYSALAESSSAASVCCGLRPHVRSGICLGSIMASRSRHISCLANRYHRICRGMMLNNCIFEHQPDTRTDRHCQEYSCQIWYAVL